MNPQRASDFRVAYRAYALALEELMFCTIHPTLVGPNRREHAIQTFSEAGQRLEEIREYAEVPR